MASGARRRLGQQAFSLALRLVSLASKFLVILLMAKYLSASELGTYGLIAAGTGYVLLFVGMDFYTFTTREMLSTSRDRWGQMLRSQAALFGVQYLVVVPALLVTALFADPQLVLWFGLILVLEHLAQEFNRLFVTMEKQVTATVILFFRAGGWCVLAIPLLVAVPRLRSLDVVLGLWVASLLVGVVVGALLLRREQIDGWGSPVDWPWVRRGLRIAIPLLLATLAMRAILNLDRFLVQRLGGLDVVGAYVLYIGIAAAMLALVESGVVVYFYPAMVRAVTRGSSASLLQAMRGMATAVGVVSVLFVAFTMLVIDQVVKILDNPVYEAHQDLMLPALLAMAAMGMSLVPHYGLYALHKDRSLLAVNVLMGAMFGVGAAVLIALSGAVVWVPWIMTGCLTLGGLVKLAIFRSAMQAPGALAPGQSG